MSKNEGVKWIVKSNKINQVCKRTQKEGRKREIDHSKPVLPSVPRGRRKRRTVVRGLQLKPHIILNLYSQ